jgi:hypothetical protein
MAVMLAAKRQSTIWRDEEKGGLEWRENDYKSMTCFGGRPVYSIVQVELPHRAPQKLKGPLISI